MDLPFITEPLVKDQFLNRGGFGDRNWTAYYAGWLTVGAFSRTDWLTTIGPKMRALPRPAPGSSAGKDEFEQLETMMRDERPDALGEIADQADEFMSYFFQVMGANQATHPATFRVLSKANLVATFVAMHFKAEFDRPRPSHLFPGLLPPLQVPGHAAFPSGHATQAHLFALCLGKMQPAAEQASAAIVLDALAGRIARNREIAGLHYSSDSAAGKVLAKEIFDILNDETRMPHDLGAESRFKAAMDKAKLEWA